ncbi:MAG: RagB/SusD family nutrient uptake outer membrane protein [Muribaculaceae bacterium]|nr:RagB/SusD family nutrient uptake outer membrane protein [Prevotella sp.]MBO5054387.1 RagB/SusD family nutrient uptake outer membrane protein [Muribaculaceae bacterium]
MKLYNFKNMVAMATIAISTLGVTSCIGDLDVENKNPQQVSELNNDALLNKIYANMVITGQKGPDGNGDLDDIDEGTSNMIRQIWNANTLTTDEAACIWGDAGIPEFNHNAWSDAHPMMKALYYRLFFGVTLSNFFLEQATGTDATILTQRAEARFMRALHYYYLMDLYGNVPIVTTVSSEETPQATRAQLFEYVESELKDIAGEGEGNEILADAKTNTYGRADKAAAWLLLSRIYLNAEVYTGTAQWQKAKDYADKAMKSGYSLCTTGMNGYTPFQLLFMGDNNTNGAQNEILLPAIHDGETTQTWGGCLFIIAGATDGDDIAIYPTGTTEKWGGNHARLQFVQKFFPVTEAPDGTPDVVKNAAGDDRALFLTQGHTASIETEGDFPSGYAYVKFLAKHADGTTTKHTQYVDTDFPMMRLAEAYLNYAEADARLNGGNCSADGLEKVNALRKRANSRTVASMSLDDLCDEWSREFGFEGMRRPTLIRFGKFGGQSAYKWQWMGGDKQGQAFGAHFNLFAIPNSVITTGGMEQNPGFK